MATLASSVASTAITATIAQAFKQNTPASSMPKGASSAYNNPLPILYGTMRLGGNLIMAGQIYEANSSGKGGMAAMFGPSASYRCDFAYAFCEGPATNVLRVWADGMLVYDVLDPSNIATHMGINLRFYGGTEDQQADPQMAEWVAQNVAQAPGAVPAYRGVCYIMFTAFTVSNFGGRIPMITAEITNSAGNLCNSVPISTSFETSSISGFGVVAVDWIKNVAYVANTSGSTHAITTIELATLTQIAQTPMPSSINGDGPLAVAQGGGPLFISGGSNNSDPVWELDSNTLGLVGMFGAYGNSFTTGTNNITAPRQIVVQQVTTLTGLAPVVLVLGVWGQYVLLNGNTMDYLYGAGSSFQLPDQSNLAGQIGVAGLSSSSDGTDIWVLSYGVTGDVAIIRFHVAGLPVYDPSSGVTQGVTVTTAAVLTPADFSPGATAAIANVAGLAYDQTDDTLIISAAGGMLKWSQSEGVVWQVSYGIAPYFSPQSNVCTSTLGFLTSVASTSYNVIDTRTGDTISSQDITAGDNDVATTYQSSIYNGLNNSLLTNWANATGPGSAPGMSIIYLGASQTTGYPIANIVQDVCVNRCGMPSDQIDTSLLTGLTTMGFAIEKVSDGKAALQTLAQAFFFDVVESDYTLRCVPRGAGAVTSIPQQDLATSGKPGDGNYWLHKRAQVIDIPTTVHVKFLDADNAYLPNAAIDKRQNAPVQTVYTKQKLDIDLPLSLHVTDAAVMAKKWLWTLWSEMDTYTATLGWKYLYLDPSDVVTVNLDNGSSYTVRVTSINTGADLTNKMEFCGEDQQVYTQSTTLQNVTSPYVNQGSAAQSGYARPFFLNLPLLLATQDTGGTSSRVYFGAGAFVANWAGGLVYTSTDGQNFTQGDTLTQGVNWGTCTNALGNVTLPFSTDNANTLTVVLGTPNAELSSTTNLEMLNGANVALVGNEIIQFQNVVDNGGGSYTLSTLLRGRLGTEWACGTHAPGETFVVLDTSFHTTAIPLSQIGSPQYDKIVPIGQYQDAAPVFGVTYKGWDLKPYAPCNFARAASGSDLAVTWVRRTRFDTNLMDGVGTVPLAEETESYDAYVLATPYNGVTAGYAAPATFVRAFTGLSSPTFTYTAAEMTTDGFNPATAALNVVVFQKSAAIGDGWPGSATLPAF